MLLERSLTQNWAIKTIPETVTFFMGQFILLLKTVIIKLSYENEHWNVQESFWDYEFDDKLQF